MLVGTLAGVIVETTVGGDVDVAVGDLLAVIVGAPIREIVGANDAVDIGALVGSFVLVVRIVGVNVCSEVGASDGDAAGASGDGADAFSRHITIWLQHVLP
jgi:hypothetical protein